MTIVVNVCEPVLLFLINCDIMIDIYIIHNSSHIQVAIEAIIRFWLGQAQQERERKSSLSLVP